MAKKEEKTLGTAIDEIINALEGLNPDARSTAVTAACEHLGILVNKYKSGDLTPPSTPISPNPESLDTSTKPIVDIEALKEEKKPKGANEMACIVAYYLQDLAPIEERKETITISDLQKYFKQAKFRLPTAIQQTLVNAKNSGYFDSAGGGAYKLNAVGYNLAVHTLPRSKK